MNTSSYTYELVMLHLRLYQREKYPFWSAAVISVVLIMTGFFVGRGILPAGGIVPFILSVIFLFNEKFIIDPLSVDDGELRKLHLYPLQARQIAAAKYSASSIIIGGGGLLTIAAATAVLHLPVRQAVDGVLFLISTLIALFVIGSALAIPLHIPHSAPAPYTLFTTFAVAVSSLPFFVTNVLWGSDLLCLLWIAASFAGLCCLIWTKSEQWIVERKYGTEDV